MIRALFIVVGFVSLIVLSIYWSDPKQDSRREPLPYGYWFRRTTSQPLQVTVLDSGGAHLTVNRAIVTASGSGTSRFQSVPTTTEYLEYLKEIGSL